MKRRIPLKKVIIAIFIFSFLISAFAAFINLRKRRAFLQRAYSSIQVAMPTLQQGVALSLFTEIYGMDPRDLLTEIRSLGASHVELVINYYQDTVHSTIIAKGATTPDEAMLRSLIRHARKQGLSVLLFPIVRVRDRRNGLWRGKLAPPSWTSWFANYQAFIVSFARLAQEEGVEWLCVGSELGTTEGFSEQWHDIIKAIRTVFKGKLLYSANWDSYRQVSFWNELDAIGISAYFEVGTAPDDPVVNLVSGWYSIQNELLHYVRRIGKPLIFTEIGYKSREGCFVHPWNETDTAPVDMDAQRRAYEAFVKSWHDIPELAGVYFWNYADGRGGNSCGNYTPRNKPALEIIKRWYGEGH